MLTRPPAHKRPSRSVFLLSQKSKDKPKGSDNVHLSNFEVGSFLSIGYSRTYVELMSVCVCAPNQLDSDLGVARHKLETVRVTLMDRPMFT